MIKDHLWECMRKRKREKDSHRNEENKRNYFSKEKGKQITK